MKWWQSKENRLLLAAAGGLAAAGAGAWLYASKLEVRRYQLDQLDIPLLQPAASASPVRILHISDLHLANPESHKIDFLQRITQEEDFDLVFLTGDVFENFSGIEYATKLLKRKPRLGAYAVLGNHDYYAYTAVHKTLGRLNRRFRHPKSKRNVESMVAALQNGGFTVLSNSWVRHSEHKLFIAGIDYFGIEDAALKSTIARAPEDHTVLVLQHVPNQLDRFARLGVDAVFCGHTHGGQVRIPGFGAIVTDSELSREEASGLLWRDKTAIHVSRGLGADPRSNFRFFCPPHATIVTLQRTAGEEKGRSINLSKRRQLQQA